MTLTDAWQPARNRHEVIMKAKYSVLVLLAGFVSVEASAHSALPRKDIPALVKAARGKPTRATLTYV